MAIHLFATEADLATVRRLSVRSAIGTTAKRKLADGSRRVWNQVAYEGEWLGHGAGEFEFTREVFDQIIANFERRTDPLPLTYGHPDSETASYMGAAGWIHALKLGTDDEGRLGLFAEMEFTERAAGQVNSGEQRHCSVVVTFEGIDEKTGEPVGAELYEVGLVLSAFIDGMRPLAAGRDRRRKNTPAHGGTNTERSLAMDAKELLEKVSEELPEGADYEQLKALLDAEHQKMKAIEGESDEGSESEGEPPAEGGDEPPAMGKDDDEKVAASAEPEGETIEAGDEPGAETVEAMDGMAYGPGAEAIVAEIVAGGGTADVIAVEAWLAENAADLAAKFQGAPQDGDEASDEAMSELGRKIESRDTIIESLRSSLSRESERANELQARIDEARDADLAKQVDAAIECGAIREERRETLLKLGRSDRELFDDTLATAKEVAPPPGVPLKRRHTPAKPGGDRSPKGSKREQLAALSSRERHFYDAQVACGKSHSDALSNAIAKARSSRVAAN
jgi:hypothetical protein